MAHQSENVPSCAKDQELKGDHLFGGHLARTKTGEPKGEKGDSLPSREKRGHDGACIRTIHSIHYGDTAPLA